MELQQQLDLVYDADAVRRSQGANVGILRTCWPGLVKIAEQMRQTSIACRSSLNTAGRNCDYYTVKGTCCYQEDHLALK